MVGPPLTWPQTLCCQCVPGPGMLSTRDGRHHGGGHRQYPHQAAPDTGKGLWHSHVLMVVDPLPVTVIIIVIIIAINPVTTRVVMAPQMTLQPVFSILPCSRLPSGICQTPGLRFRHDVFRPLHLSALFSFPLLLCLARWFWPDVKSRKCAGRAIQISSLYDCQENF